MQLKTCSKCKENKSIVSFYRMSTSKDGHRPDCKVCSKEAKEEFKQKNPIKDRCNRMSNAIMSRTVWDVDKKKNKSYKERGIISEIGNTGEEISEFLYKNYYEEIGIYILEGIQPSVDRIDSNKNYAKDNIRIISLGENVQLGLENAVKVTSKALRVVYPDGKEKIFGSVSGASRELGIKRDTIIFNRDKGSKTSEGYYFMYLTGELTEEEKLDGLVKYRATIIANTLVKAIKRTDTESEIGTKLSEVKEFVITNYSTQIKEAYKSNIAVGIALHDVNKGYILNNIYLENQEYLTKGALKNRSSKK